jgi:hypothetical protein
VSLAQQTIVYDVEQFKIYPMIGDDIVGSASPTYGDGVVCQGVSDISFAPDITSNTLKGDGGRTIAKVARAAMWTLSVTYGRLGLDALSLMLGGTLTDTGAGPAEQIRWALSMPNRLPFFLARFLIIDTDNGVGGVVAELLKCQLKTQTFADSKTDSFGQPKIELEAIPLNSTGEIGDITLYATTPSLP